jgi:hypothetical protein
VRGSFNWECQLTHAIASHHRAPPVASVQMLNPLAAVWVGDTPLLRS